MKEIYLTEWIYKKANNKTTNIFPLRVPDHINKSNDFKKGYYLVKLYKLETEAKD